MSVGIPTSPGPPVRHRDAPGPSSSSSSVAVSTALGRPIGPAPVAVHPATLPKANHTARKDQSTTHGYHPTSHPVPLAMAGVDGVEATGPPVVNGHRDNTAVANGYSDDITVDEIQAHMLDDYGAEARRLELEERVHLEMLELERRKDRDRIVPGVDNDDLNAMLRSFDKQVQTVHQCPPPYDGRIPRGLDLQSHPEEEFNLHKLNSALERFYASVGVGMLRTIKEVNRIRHWEDGGTRTAVALAVYAYAWWCNMIIPTLLAFLSVLIFFPEAREFFFAPPLDPPPPHKHVSRDDTTAIAEDKLRDEWSPAGTESRATSWAQNVQHLLMSLSSPKGGSAEAERVTEVVQKRTDAHLDEDLEKREEAGALKEGEKDMSRKDKAIMMYAQPAMRIIGGLADKWERIANAINPSPAWEVRTRRTSVFMYLIAPLLVVFTFTPEWVFSRIFGLIFGFILFGDPLISHIIDELDRAIPDWKERLILEHNLLEDVPTNAQLVLRILRNAEHHNHPIPPAPTDKDLDEGDDDGSDSSDSSDQENGDENDHEDGEDDEEGRRKKAMKKMSQRAKKTKDGVRAKARRTWDKLGEVKEKSFAVVTGHRPIDLEGKAERAMDKLHIDKEGGTAEKILEKLPGEPDDSPESPSTFYVHHKKHGPGHLIIYPRDLSTGAPARVEFTTIRRVPASQNTPIDPTPGAQPEKGHLVVPIDDIVGLQKVGMSVPGRLAVGWALDAEGAGGTGLNVSVVRRNVAEAVEVPEGVPSVAQGKEEVVNLSGIVRRNELFDRLLALGDQRWDVF